METARRNLFMLTGCLLALGTVMVYSASFVYAERRFGAATFFLERHCIYVLLGCAALFTGCLCDYHWLARRWQWLFPIAGVLLAAVLIPGVGATFNGARRWFAFGPVTFQPSEAVKPLLVAALAGWLVSRRERLGSFREGFLPSAGLVAGAAGLVALEPDLGTAMLLFGVLGAMLFSAGLKLRHALPAAGAALLLAASLAWMKLDYLRARFGDWWSGGADPLGRSYQSTQALIAQGSGGLVGCGVGQGKSKLLFLPEPHNDFILALIGEELGWLGAAAVVCCFACLVWLGWRIARRAPDLLGSLIAFGLTLMLGAQAALNIAVVTRSVPTKGIALPLVSYGGSALIFTLFSIGLLLNVAAHLPAPAPEVAAAPSRFGELWRALLGRLSNRKVPQLAPRKV
jgi:cell division protein FtsW